MDRISIIASHIQEEIQALERDIASGNAKDYAQYQSACGQRLGLMKAIGFIQEAQERIEKAYREEETGGTRVG